MNVKGDQGRKLVMWVKPEHPYTAISPKSEVHANHNEAHNSALRRRCSAAQATDKHLCKAWSWVAAQSHGTAFSTQLEQTTLGIRQG